MGKSNILFGLCKKYGIKTDGKSQIELWREVNEAKRREARTVARRLGVADELNSLDELLESLSGIENVYVGRYWSEAEMGRRISSFIKEYQKRDVEYALVFLEDGEVWFSRGTGTSVLEDFPKSLSGATVIHNHTDGETEYSFSDEDYMLFTESGMRTLYGFDSKYVYRFSREDLSIDEAPLIGEEDAYMHGETIRNVTDNLKKYKVGYRRYKFDDE